MNSSPSKLQLDWCSFEAAKYACTHWHYSRTLPWGKIVKIGVWEKGSFIGAIVFGAGANRQIGSPFGLKQTEICELLRIALKDHKNPVSKILSIAVKMLKALCPGLRLIISYADMEQNHLGVIYQASNWIYTGITKSNYKVFSQGKLWHNRSASFTYGSAKIDHIRKSDPKAHWVVVKPKHKYLFPLDRKLRNRLERISKQYPKT